MSKKPKTTSAAASKAEKPPKRGEKPEEIAKLLGQIEKAEKAVQVAEIELDSRKEAAKSAKAEWLVKIGELRTLVRTRERWAAEAKRQPLFTKKADAPLPEGAKRIGILRDVKDGETIIAKKGDEAAGFVADNGRCHMRLPSGLDITLGDGQWAEIVDAKPAEPASAEWRKHGVEKLNGEVTAKDREKLAAAGVPTLGELQDRMVKHGTFWFQDLTGIGRAAADRIENSFNSAVAEFSA